MSKVTKAEYRAALAQHLPDVVEAGQVEDSWKTFLDAIHERGAFAPGYRSPEAIERGAKIAAAQRAQPVDE